MTMTTTIEPTDTVAELFTTPAWLIQYLPFNARALQTGWDAGEDVEYPAVNRHLDAVAENDLVYFWVSGPGPKAGIIGLGLASGHQEELDHARNYRDPDGPRARRDSAEVSLCCVFEEPIMTREELKGLAAFEGFDLFTMPNRPNAFAVTPAQSAVILRRFEEVMGR